MKTEIMQKIIEKQDELIDLLEREIGMLYDISRVRRNKANYTNVTLLGQELASLKSQLEAGEEKKELRGCINCKYREAVYSGIMCDNCYYHRHWEPR